jgi:hypothetical protein
MPPMNDNALPLGESSATTLESPSAAKPASRPGRPRAFTEARREHFCSLVRMGCRRGVAAQMIGLSRHTVRRVLRREPDFAERIQQLEAEAAFRFVRQINQASATQWRAAAWIIEQAEKPSPRALTVRKLVRSREFQAAVERVLAGLTAGRHY